MTQANRSNNYAEEVAKPVEKNLAEAGGVKKCSIGDDGRGSDSSEPDYHAIYEMPGNREQATSLTRSAFEKAGYKLVDGSKPPSPEDNLFYEDNTSKESPYLDLGNGKIDMRLEIFGSSTYTGAGDQFCTVTKRSNPPTDKTTIWVTVNLPSFKGR